MCCGVIPSGLPDEPRGNVHSAFMTSSLETCNAWKRGLSLGSYGVRRSWAGPGCFVRSAFRVSWLVGAGVSLELMIWTAARKLPASNLLDTAAASLLLSFDFLLVLLSVVCEWTIVTASLSHAAVLLLLKFLFDPPLFCLARMTGRKWSNSSQAVLLLGLPFILLRISVSSAALDGLAARGMRLTSVTQEGCDSFDTLPDVASDCSSWVWIKVSVWRLVISAEGWVNEALIGGLSDLGHGLSLWPAYGHGPWIDGF